MFSYLIRLFETPQEREERILRAKKMAIRRYYQKNRHRIIEHVKQANLLKKLYS